ncbi:hypothetical protein EW146_g8605 [Bondarzewia mesenterica]|uniref:Uncharacterized protein n=1 Tax=Bondarzewia mesenterica TaxID=1095465 RepID=A0A4S4LDJ5_9AGAM|nr:hypothetical protein EW146_g8605 [Bondarzewia mesenterica]
MHSTINITFLGTCSSQPSTTRNHSAMALRLSGDVWLFDCGEATQHQLQKSSVRMGRIQKIFITHTHGDHIFGLVPLLASCLDGTGGTVEPADDKRVVEGAGKPLLEIYGPLGTRAYLRSGLTYTHTVLGSPYVVHELRFPTDPQDGDYTSLPPLPYESPEGRNITQVDGLWPDIFKDTLISVSAAPVHHSVPCVGYVVQEAPIPGRIQPAEYMPHIERTGAPRSVLGRIQKGENVELSDGTILKPPERRPGRKLAILGDTYDPSPIADLAAGADILIHEATNAHLPGVVLETKDSDTYETVEERTKSRGHSTPQMAGAFAHRIGAKALLLNHFSARYAGNDDEDYLAKKMMTAIKNLARQNFKGTIICARDFLSFDVNLSQ